MIGVVGQLQSTQVQFRQGAVGPNTMTPSCPRSPDKENVAASMKRTSRIYNPEYVVALGDNFYFYGVQNETDIRFKTTFEDVYQDQGSPKTHCRTVQLQPSMSSMGVP